MELAMSTLLQRIVRDIRESVSRPRADDRYLAQSTDIGELERRMRALDRDNLPSL
jgi:hypothetical protein